MSALFSWWLLCDWRSSWGDTTATVPQWYCPCTEDAYVVVALVLDQDSQDRSTVIHREQTKRRKLWHNPDTHLTMGPWGLCVQVLVSYLYKNILGAKWIVMIKINTLSPPSGTCYVQPCALVDSHGWRHFCGWQLLSHTSLEHSAQGAYHGLHGYDKTQRDKTGTKHSSNVIL